MICRNCNRDAGNASFCPYCGAPMRSKYCPRCGVPLPPDGRACYSCGWKESSATEQELASVRPAPEVNSGDKGLMSGKREDKQDDAPASARKRSGVQTFMCLVSGIAVLASLGVALYLMLMGNMFSVNGTAYNPLTMQPAADGAFGLVTHFSDIIAYFSDVLPDAITNSAGGWDLQTMGMYASSALLTAVYAVGGAIVSVTTLVAVIRFIVGIARGRNFNMAKYAALALAASGTIWMSGRFGYLGSYVSVGSGTFVCMIVSAAALAVCLVNNLVFAGRSAAKGGSILKLLTNACIFACAAVCFLAFPFRLSSSYVGTGSETFVGILDIAVAAINGEQTTYVTIIGLVAAVALAVLTVKYLFTLPFYMSKTASRLARTFKLDGYRDKGFVFRSVVLIVGALPFVVFAFVYLKGASATPSAELIAFIISVAATFVVSIMNRMCLNKDQL